MKNRSIFWPLAMIAAGVIWILVSMGNIPKSNLWALAQIWPFVLIALGLGLIVRAYWNAGGMLISALIVIFAVLAVLFAPQLGWDHIPSWGWQFDTGARIGGGVAGSGKIMSQTRIVDGFSAISIDYPAEVIIQQGDTESVTLKTDDNLLPQISTQIQNGVLYIRNTEADWGKRVNPTKNVLITIKVKELRDVDFSTAGKLRIENLHTEELQLSISGAGDVTVVKINTRNLDLRLSGTGNIKVDGIADEIDLRISGLGSFDGAELIGQNANVRISGAGDATLWVEHELTAEISGAGTVNYYGTPNVRQKISGVGTVKSLGSK